MLSSKLCITAQLSRHNVTTSIECKMASSTLLKALIKL
jgi:hypothetical protein